MITFIRLILRGYRRTIFINATIRRYKRDLAAYHPMPPEKLESFIRDFPWYDSRDKLVGRYSKKYLKEKLCH